MAEEQLTGIEPVYLTLDDVLELYGLITAAEAGDQLRNHDGLESALARPETYAHYQDADLALQAAVLAHGIAEGQQFIDGNKRTALVAMLTFLEINGWRVEARRTLSWPTGFSASAPVRLLRRLQRSCVRQCAAPISRSASGRARTESPAGAVAWLVRSGHARLLPRGVAPRLPRGRARVGRGGRGRPARATRRATRQRPAGRRRRRGRRGR